jgi:hypothetical protein
MTGRLNHCAQSGRHTYADRGADLYETPPVAVEALLRAKPLLLPHRIWEPCCARGNIASVLRQHGHTVIATDLVDCGPPVTCPGYYGVDFLAQTKAPAGTGCVLTNPPYRFAEFVAHALELVPLAIFLLRLGFIESEWRSPILDSGKLAHIHAFKNRLPFMHRDGWKGPRASSAIPFASFVFDRNHTGLATIDRIAWTRDG